MYNIYGAIILAQIGVGWLFVRWLIQQDRGPKEPKKALVAAGLFGVAAVALAMFLEFHFLPNADIDQISRMPRSEIFHTALLVGIIEELAKSLPLALFLYGKRYFNEMTDGIIYFAIAGMTFGVIEDIGYTLSFGPATGLSRIIMGPYIHAGFCAVFGWMLARNKVVKSLPFGVVASMVAAIGLHSLYDFGLFYRQGWSVLMSLAITVTVNAGVFFLLRQAQKIDVRLGLATSGNNYYCRSCGAPNPQRFLYCTQCGQRT